MLQAQVTLAQNIPVDMVAQYDGHSAVVCFRWRGGQPVVDDFESGKITGIYFPTGFTLKDTATDAVEEYEYLRWYAYKEDSLLLQWLKQFKLMM